MYTTWDAQNAIRADEKHGVLNAPYTYSKCTQSGLYSIRDFDLYPIFFFLIFLFTYLSFVYYYFFFLGRKFANTIPKTFGIRYNPYTQSVQVLDSKLQLQELANNISNELQILRYTLNKMD